MPVAAQGRGDFKGNGLSWDWRDGDDGAADDCADEEQRRRDLQQSGEAGNVNYMLIRLG